MILIYHLKSLTDEYSIILATWPFGEPPPPHVAFRGLLADPPPPLLATWFLNAPLAKLRKDTIYRSSIDYLGFKNCAKKI